jgi:tetratricopeptide (TPR) repeat protein
MTRIVSIFNALSALVCAIPFMFGGVLAYWGLIGLEHGDYSAIVLGVAMSAASAAIWAASVYGSRRLKERGRFLAAFVAAVPILIVAPLAFAVFASSHGSAAPLPTAYARPKISRPLWEACAYPLDMQSHLNVEKLTSLIDSGKIGGADLAQALEDRGCIRESFADDALAIADYSKALALDPNDAEIYFVRGRTYGNARQYALALADYDSALRLTPNDSETYYRRGHLFEDGQHEHEKAVADYNSSIRLEPDNPAAYEMRAVAYENLGRNEEAAADKETAKRLAAAPSSPVAAKRAAGEWE